MKDGWWHPVPYSVLSPCLVYSVWYVLCMCGYVLSHYPLQYSDLENSMDCLVYGVAKSQTQLSNPMDCSLPGSSVRGILQARLLEWVAMPSSRGSSRPRDQTLITTPPALEADPLPRSHQGIPCTVYSINIFWMELIKWLVKRIFQICSISYL